MTDTQLLFRIRFWLGVEVAGLVLAGVTAFPLVHESPICLCSTSTSRFLDRVAHGLDETSRVAIRFWRTAPTGWPSPISPSPSRSGDRCVSRSATSGWSSSE